MIRFLIQWQVLFAGALIALAIVAAPVVGQNHKQSQCIGILTDIINPTPGAKIEKVLPRICLDINNGNVRDNNLERMLNIYTDDILRAKPE
jgi:hypothetical protein